MNGVYRIKLVTIGRMMIAASVGLAAHQAEALVRWLERRRVGYAPPLLARYIIGVLALMLAGGDWSFARRLWSLAAPLGVGVAIGHWFDHLHEAKSP